MTELQRKIKEELKRLQKEEMVIEKRISALQDYLEAEEPKTRTPGNTNKRLQNRTDLIEKVLKKAGKPLHYKEIIEKLENEEGYQIKAKDKEATITATLSLAKDRFERAARGIYKIREQK
jgi:hypothetical protein